jgi:hypothetical protein
LHVIELMGEWLELVVAFRTVAEEADAEDPASTTYEEEELLWSVLGVSDGDFLDMLILLRPRFVNQRLYLGSIARDLWSPEFARQVGDVLLRALTVDEATSSRWMSVSFSCRGLSAGLVWGVTDLVRHIRESGRNVDTYSKGFLRLDVEIFVSSVHAG